MGRSRWLGTEHRTYNQTMKNVAYSALLPMGFFCTWLLCTYFPFSGERQFDPYQWFLIIIITGTSAAFTLAVVQFRIFIASRARLICLFIVLGLAAPYFDRLNLPEDVCMLMIGVPALLATLYLTNQQLAEILE